MSCQYQKPGSVVSILVEGKAGVSLVKKSKGWECSSVVDYLPSIGGPEFDP